MLILFIGVQDHSFGDVVRSNQVRVADPRVSHDVSLPRHWPSLNPPKTTAFGENVPIKAGQYMQHQICHKTMEWIDVVSQQDGVVDPVLVPIINFAKLLSQHSSSSTVSTPSQTMQSSTSKPSAPSQPSPSPSQSPSQVQSQPDQSLAIDVASGMGLSLRQLIRLCAHCVRYHHHATITTAHHIIQLLIYLPITKHRYPHDMREMLHQNLMTRFMNTSARESIEKLMSLAGVPPSPIPPQVIIA